MESPSQSVEKPVKPRLRRYQFSLRTLLIVVTLFAVACSWFAVKMGQAKRQREAVEVLSKSVDSIFYDYQCNSSGSLTAAAVVGKASPPGPTWLRQWLGDDFFTNVVSLHLHRIADADLEYVRDFPKLKILGLHWNKITDNGLKHIKALDQLQALDLQSTEITDKGLESLGGFSSLQWLSLFNTKITDAGLKNLQGLKEIHDLYLGETEITDSGLENIKGLTRLKRLGLDHTKISDAGLVHLRGLSQLENLYLKGTKVTDAGVEGLQKALPNLKIERE